MDAHTHVAPAYADLAVEVMDRCGVERCVTLEWHDGFGPTLRRHLQVFGRHPGRFVVFGNVDWRRVNEPGFGEAAARQIRDDVRAGMRGLKIYKALGLEYRRPDGELWRVDDPAFDPIWCAAGDLGLPVLMHTADPPFFWEPVTPRNFWDGVLRGEYAWWAYYRKGMPSPDELLGERNEVLARHPGTTFICPHVGSRAECLDRAAEDLEAFPNLFYDLSARLPILGCNARRAAHAREFLMAFQDRVLFGTDIIYDDTNVPTGMQAQCLYQPYEIPLAGQDAQRRYAETTVAFFRSHVEFLTTDRVQTSPPFRRRRTGIELHGVALPGETAERILASNAERILRR
jgi:predicted TIM-barrel fold metal-dependent hydrolase